MAQFSDSKSGVWLVSVTMGTVKRVKDETGFNVLDLVDPRSDLVKQLARDPVDLFLILTSVLRPQLVERGISDDQFAELLNEAQIDAACTALMEATFDFFQPKKRGILKNAHAKVNTAFDRVRNQSMEEAERALASPTIDLELEEAFRKGLGLSAGSSPASSA